jgi:hypothetical protein
MDAFESVADNDGFEDIPDSPELKEPEPKEPELTREEPELKREEPKREEPKREEPKPVSALGRSEKQQRVDAARAEQLRKLKERYNVEFANIQKKRPKPKAYNAAAVLSASDPEAKIKQILARDRAIYNAKQARKGDIPRQNTQKEVTKQNTRKRNAPSILSSTRSAASQIREKAKDDLKALKESAEKELREIGANISILHPIFNREPARPKSRTRTIRSLPARLNQITRNNN